MFFGVCLGQFDAGFDSQTQIYRAMKFQSQNKLLKTMEIALAALISTQMNF